MPSRRSFLKLAGAAALGAAFSSRSGDARRLPRSADPRAARQILPPGEWPANVRLGRGALGWGAPILSRPHPEGAQLGYVYPDDVVRIVRDVVGLGMAYHTHVWFELEEGYVYSPYLQPVVHAPQVPADVLPPEGLWGEVITPYIDGLARPDAAAPVVYRLYYSAVFRIAELLTGADGAPWYRATMETGINLHVPASTLRIIQAEELTPISPDVDPAEKRIVVYLADQALSAFESGREVFRTRISSGANYFGEDGVTLLNGTPRGEQHIWSKRISRHMQGGTIDAGYDVPGVGWVAYFAGNGAALHSTYWHNDFGIPKSHGCLNCRPEDAKWVFRWTMPHVAYVPGDITVNWENRGTTLDLQEAS
jgi:lipoprotein-anchoring transpeptidase ErfK/SrfK